LANFARKVWAFAHVDQAYLHKLVYGRLTLQLGILRTTALGNGEPAIKQPKFAAAPLSMPSAST
jgi:hypothetical protein